MSEIKNIHAFEREKKLFTDTFGVDPREISNRDFIAAMRREPLKTKRYNEEASVTNAHSCANYAAQFVNLVNSFPEREIPYLVIGVKCAVNAILKADVDAKMKYKFKELDELCKKILTAYAFTNQKGDGDAE